MAGAAPVATTSEDQSEVFSFLENPRTFGSSVAVRRIDTHGAAVFLAGLDAYKVKRAVRFPFMDFSTLEKRRLACEAEIAINKPDAPDIYLGVVPIVRTSSGLALGGAGKIIEWAVHMRRFDEEATLDRLADRGALRPELLSRLVEAILRSHDRAPRRDGRAAFEALARYLDQNEAAFAAAPALFDPARAQILARDARAALAATRDLLLSRGKAGYVRRCHGDLHLRNIVLIDDAPTLFDAVEFDDEIATGDVLYDLAFLLMDLEERRLRPAANLLLNRYLWRSEEAHLAGLAALPIFLSIRSAIRAKVVAAGLPHLRGEARDRAQTEAQRYFWFAEEFLKPQTARLVAIGGLSGTGKSVLASRLAPLLGRAPGAVWLRSDIERKRLFGVGETDRLPQEAYKKEAARDVYALLCRKAALALYSRQSVIVDAVHSTQDERDGVASVAAGLGIDFTGLWLEAPLEARLERVTNRMSDASDADAAIAAAQKSDAQTRPTWRRIDASGDIEAVTRAALSALELPATGNHVTQCR
jgi:aminoglycoside phosphotransferase family enzyme/predicted kinase